MRFYGTSANPAHQTHAFSRYFFAEVVEIVRFSCRLLSGWDKNMHFVCADSMTQKRRNWAARRANVDAIMCTCAPVPRTHAFLRVVCAISVFCVGGARVYAFYGDSASFWVHVGHFVCIFTCKTHPSANVYFPIRFCVFCV